MRRKLVKQGAATMMVSLPSKWIKQNSLEKGDEIELEEKNNELIVKSRTDSSVERAVELNISSLLESSIITIITNAYRLGYDKIKINFSDKEAIPIIERTIKNNLIGFEIIKRNGKSCEIENITEPLKDQFDNIFSKVFLNIEELFKITKNFFGGQKEEFREIESKIQQFDNFCRRVVVKKSIENPQLIWTFHAEIIHAQRHLYLILRYLEEKRVKIGKGIFSLLEDCKNMFEMLKKAYYGKNVKILEEIHVFEKSLTYKKGYDLIERENPIIVHHILSAIRSFYLASSPLFGVSISVEE